MEKTFLQKLASIFKRKTYTISPESFKEQFANVTSGSMKSVEINNPLSQPGRAIFLPSMTYNANQLRNIQVLDNDGNPATLVNSPALETRVTLKNGKKKHFYFDTLIIEEDCLRGGKSRFISSLSEKIPFEDIVRIEVQNGGKKFNYQ